MSSADAVRDVGVTLVSLLAGDEWTGFEEKPALTLKSPKELKDDHEDNKIQVSLFLYQILENPHLRNQEPERDDDLRFRPPPLALDLFYLITAYGKDKEDEHRLLGKVMQIFHDHAMLSGAVLKGGLGGPGVEIKILSNPISLNDLTQLWSAFPDVAYRLSVSYLVTPIIIDSTPREVGAQRVLSREYEYYSRGKKL